jgi:Gpi18-like mannosyltransferase
MPLRQIIKYFVIWQVLIIVVTIISSGILPLRGTYLGGGSILYLQNPILYSRANFDGNHYIAIARNGYGYAQQAFFPLYPKIIRAGTNYAKPNHASQFRVAAIVGVLVSAAAFLAALWILGKLLRLDYSEKVVRLALLLILVFPTSFYFTAVYTEGLFFLLIVASFYAARTNRWWLAGLLGGLASYTRFVGILIFPALFFEFLDQRKKHQLSWQVVFLILVPCGLLAYMNYLFRTTGDPLAFFHSLAAYGEFRSSKVILLYQVFWRYMKMITSVNRGDPLYITIALEVLTGVLFLGLSIYSFVKQRMSYAVFNALAYIVPTLTGSFVSLPRYVLVCFPAFALLATLIESRPRLRSVILLVSTGLFLIFLTMFARGYWVA